MNRRQFTIWSMLSVSWLSACIMQDSQMPLEATRILSAKKVKLEDLRLLIDGPDIQIRGFLVNRRLARKTWVQLRDISDQTGYRPVLLGEETDLEDVSELLSLELSQPKNSITQASRIESETWFEARKHQDLLFEELGEVTEVWPTEFVPNDELYVAQKHLWSESDEIFLGLVPTQESWQIPACLNFGGWNDCPMPEIHVALHKKWEAEYGAEIITAMGDTIECLVSNPPTSREAALNLAKEQFLYAPDIVFQGVPSIEALAATLLNASVWYFWWD